MKKLLLIFIVTSLCSCTITYYQVYKAIPADQTVKRLDNHLVYEDDNCIVSYRFWGSGGDIGFVFRNKTDKNIYLHLDECFYVANGVAYDYYKNRIFTQSKSNTSSTTASYGAAKSLSYGQSSYNSWLNAIAELSASVAITRSASAGQSSTTEFSVAYTEDKNVCIPPGTSKRIAEYKIKEEVYRECGYLRFPTVKEIRTKTFSKDNTPLIFSNKIAYSFGNENIIRFENIFYIAEITNYPKKTVISYIHEYCGKKINSSRLEAFKQTNSNEFYIEYIKDGGFEF